MQKILCLIDWSYFSYYVIYGAVNRFSTTHKDDAETLIKPPEETDQDNLPNLLVNPWFKKELKRSVISRCETIDWILKQNFQDEIDNASMIDFIAVQDDFLMNSFRKTIYPEYKESRKLVKKSYDVNAIKNYIDDVIVPELEETGQFNYKKLKVSGAEGDDVIAITLMNHKNDYDLRILFASDKDFLQIDGIRQYDLSGKEVISKIKVKNEEIILDNKTSLLVKILSGDTSDNIPAIMERVGKVKAYKLAKDKTALQKLLKENQSAASQFALNRKIIDFTKIPKELSDRILENVNKLLDDTPKISRESFNEIRESIKDAVFDL